MEDIIDHPPGSPAPDGSGLTKKVIYWNLGIMLVPALVVFLVSLQETGHYAGMGYGMYMMVIPPVHAIICAIIGVVLRTRKAKHPNNGPLAKGFISSASLVLLIGTSLCFGGMGLL